MCSKIILCSLAACAGLVAPAFAQTPLPLVSPDFEMPNPVNPSAPNQFTNNGDTDARYRSNTDGLLPAVTARSGERCMEIRVPNDNGFVGFTTDTRNFFLPGFPFFDPEIDYNGGDIRITCWYMIPANEPITVAPAAIKLDLKGAGNGFQNNATLDPWGTEGPFADRVILGHTNGEWVLHETVWTQAEIQAQVQGNVDLGFFTIPPNPNRVKITIGRFGYGIAGATGTIFWDDLTVEQVLPPGDCLSDATPCRADQDGDDDVDSDDINAFFTAFESGDSCGDQDGDDDVDSDDINIFFARFEAGGC